MSYREYLTRIKHRELQWNRPSRSDYYIMGLTQVVRQLFAKRPESIKLNDQRIEFNTGEKKKPQQTGNLFKSLMGIFGGAAKRQKRTGQIARTQPTHEHRNRNRANGGASRR